MPILASLGAGGIGAYRLFRGAAPILSDSFFNQVTLLLPGNGTNGAQNNTFLDGSINALTITRNGTTTQGTFSPYGSNWSNYFDGTGDYLTAPSNTAFALGTGDFTVEFWFYLTVMQDSAFWGIGTSTTSGGVMFRLDNPGTSFNFYNNGDNLFTGSGISANTWYHLAVVRSSGTLKVYVNGTQYGSSLSNSTNIAQDIFYIGCAKVGSTVPYNPINGYMSNIRVLKGTAQYTANFTPPTAPLTAITNTSLLTCQSNRYIDNSTNAFTITRNGDMSVQRFSPFSPTASYDSAIVGGSGYFPESDGGVVVPSNAVLNLGTGAFTVDCWIYRPTSGTDYIFFGNNFTNGLWAFVSGSKIVVGIGSADRITSTGDFQNNAWNHVAIVRSGTTTTLYINGVANGSYTNTITINQGAWTVGNYSAGYSFNGYIANFRLVKGTAVYTGAFTPPTALLSTSGSASASAYPSTTNVNTSFPASETSVLLNFTNAGIIDNAMMNDLETMNDAQISTTQSKFGGGSMLFDGTGDALTIRPSPDLQLGSGDWTVEMWVYLNSTAVTQDFFSLWNGGTTGSSYAFLYDSNLLYFYWYTTVQTSVNVSWTPSTATWYHLAFSKSGTTLRFFVNGTQQGSNQTVSTTPATGTVPVYVGGLHSPTRSMNGYIDDLRITKGVARYTANFAAPTAPFPTYRE